MARDHISEDLSGISGSAVQDRNLSYRRRCNESQIGDVFSWKDGSERKSRTAREYRSSRHSDMLDDFMPAAGVPTFKKPQKSATRSQVEHIQSNLVSLNDDRSKLLRELEKIPDSKRSVAQRKRKGQLEYELEQVENSIDTLKDQIRTLNSTQI